MNEAEKAIADYEMVVKMSQQRIKKFWSFVNPIPTENGCHIWIGSGVRYGRFWLNPKTLAAHRIAYLMHYGRLPFNKLKVLHNCPGGDNTHCVNWRHLWPGTQLDNIRDCIAKHRLGSIEHPEKLARGESIHLAKMNAVKVVEIRKQRDAGRIFAAIGSEFGISISAVHAICSRHTWKHVP